jgi:hypothetical protein
MYLSFYEIRLNHGSHITLPTLSKTLLNNGTQITLLGPPPDADARSILVLRHGGSHLIEVHEFPEDRIVYELRMKKFGTHTEVFHAGEETPFAVVTDGVLHPKLTREGKKVRIRKWLKPHGLVNTL